MNSFTPRIIIITNNENKILPLHTFAFYVTTAHITTNETVPRMIQTHVSSQIHCDETALY